ETSSRKCSAICFARRGSPGIRTVSAISPGLAPMCTLMTVHLLQWELMPLWRRRNGVCPFCAREKWPRAGRRRSGGCILLEILQEAGSVLRQRDAEIIRDGRPDIGEGFAEGKLPSPRRKPRRIN